MPSDTLRIPQVIKHALNGWKIVWISMVCWKIHHFNQFRSMIFREIIRNLHVVRGFPLPPWLPEGAMVSQGQQIDAWIWLNRSYILIYTYLIIFIPFVLVHIWRKTTLVVDLTCDACVCVFVHLCLQAIATYIPLRIQFCEVHVWGTYQVVQAKSSNTVPDHGNTVPDHGAYTKPAHA